MKNEYFKPEHTDSIKKYILAPTNEEKNRIIEKELYQVLVSHCEAAIKKIRGIEPDEDKVQDLMIIIISKVLPKIKPDMVDGWQNYLWVSLVNACNNAWKSDKCKPISYINVEYVSTVSDFDNYTTSTSTNEFEVETELNEVKKQIIAELDKKISKQQIINSTNALFLLLLKQYCIEHNFDCSDFKPFIMKEMDINIRGFWNICSEVNIRSKELGIRISKKYLK